MGYCLENAYHHIDDWILKFGTSKILKIIKYYNNIIIEKMFFYITGNFTQLCDYINKSSDMLAKNSSHLDNVYATLDIQQASLGILGIL